MHEGLGATLPAGSVLQSFVLEGVLTFLLMFVILCVAIGAKEKGLMAGTAIGGTVALDSLFAGPISGASMNPVRSLAPALITFEFTDQWLYVVAPLIGAVIAVVVYWGVYGKADQKDNPEESHDVQTGQPDHLSA